MESLGGMTVNERFFAVGLDSEWTSAVGRRDRDAMLKLLGRVELADQAERIIDTLMKRLG